MRSFPIHAQLADSCGTRRLRADLPTLICRLLRFVPLGQGWSSNGALTVGWPRGHWRWSGRCARVQWIESHRLVIMHAASLALSRLLRTLQLICHQPSACLPTSQPSNLSPPPPSDHPSTRVDACK